MLFEASKIRHDFCGFYFLLHNIKDDTDKCTIMTWCFTIHAIAIPLREYCKCIEVKTTQKVSSYIHKCYFSTHYFLNSLYSEQQIFSSKHFKFCHENLCIHSSQCWVNHCSFSILLMCQGKRKLKLNDKKEFNKNTKELTEQSIKGQREKMLSIIFSWSNTICYFFIIFADVWFSCCFFFLVCHKRQNTSKCCGFSVQNSTSQPNVMASAMHQTLN